jgi:hypothetical protein
MPTLPALGVPNTFDHFSGAAYSAQLGGFASAAFTRKGAAGASVFFESRMDLPILEKRVLEQSSRRSVA